MDELEQKREEAVRYLERHAQLSRRQVAAIGQGDELGQRRGRREMAEALERARLLADEVAAARESVST